MPSSPSRLFSSSCSHSTFADGETTSRHPGRGLQFSKLEGCVAPHREMVITQDFPSELRHLIEVRRIPYLTHRLPPLRLRWQLGLLEQHDPKVQPLAHVQENFSGVLYG